MKHEFDISVPADHPALPGHFPGQPIVPGVVLLELAIEAAQRALAVHVRTIASAKFTSPLAPDVPCRMIVRRRDDGRIEARCIEGLRTIMTAVLEIEG